MMTLKTDQKFAHFLVLLFMACATLFANQASARQQLEIIDARYGTREHSVDVSYILRNHIRHGHLRIRVDNDSMRTDPYPGREKQLRVRYRENGQQQSVRVRENEWLDIGRSEPKHDDGWNGGGRPDNNRDLEIIRAEYGSGGRYWDVTDRVQRKVRGDSISMQVNNDAMGGDPRPNRSKELRVKYRYKNKNREETVHEGDWFTVGSGSGGGGWNRPPDRPSHNVNLEIVQAQYGANGRYWDVTDRIRHEARNGSVSMRVNNRSMGGDPAPNQVKELRVKYRQRGEKQHIRVREGDWLTIN
jgi:hypothetical protein